MWASPFQFALHCSDQNWPKQAWRETVYFRYQASYSWFLGIVGTDSSITPPCTHQTFTFWFIHLVLKCVWGLIEMSSFNKVIYLWNDSYQIFTAGKPTKLISSFRSIFFLFNEILLNKANFSQKRITCFQWN